MTVIVSAVCLSVEIASHFIMRHYLLEQTYFNLKDTAEKIRYAASGFFAERKHEIDNVSRSKTIKLFLYEPTPGKLISVQEELLTHAANYFEISLVDGKGMEAARIVRNRPSVRYYDRSKTDYFRKAKASEDGEYISTFYLSPAGQVERIYAKRVEDFYWVFLGELVAKLDISKLYDRIGNIKVGRSGRGYIINEYGRFIYHFKREKIIENRLGEDSDIKIEKITADLKNKDFKLVRAAFEGVDSLVAYAPIKDLHWYVVLALPYKEFNHGLIVLGYMIFIIGAVIVALGAIMGMFVIRVFFRPIRILSGAMDSVAKGDLNQLVVMHTKDELGRLAGSFNKMVDNLKLSRDDLKRSNELMTKITDSIEEGIMLLDKDFKIIWCNNRIKEDFSSQREDILGAHCYKAVFQSDYFCKDEEVTCALEKLTNLNCPFANLQAHVNYEGRKSYVECVIYPLFDEKGKAERYVHVIRDVTKRIELEDKLKENILVLELAQENLRIQMAEDEKRRQAIMNMLEDIKLAREELLKANQELKFTQGQLIQAEKLRTIGTLATGVAHEVKNPLAILLQGVEYLSKRVSSQDKETALIINYITDAVKRADRIIQGLVDFSSSAKVTMSKGNINEVLESSLLLLKNDIEKNHIELIKDFENGIPLIDLDKGRMEQALVNIILNAVQAMNEGGRLEIKTYSERLGGQASQIVVQIKDNGTGVPQENLDEIFDPFFTTKRDTGGTGLGLPIVRNVIDIHKGQIEIKNRQDTHGAIVTLSFIANEQRA